MSLVTYGKDDALLSGMGPARTRPMRQTQLGSVQKLNRGGAEGKMRTVKALMAGVAVTAFLVLSSTAAMAATFTVDTTVGWLNNTATCAPVNNACIAFNGTGGFA